MDVSGGRPLLGEPSVASEADARRRSRALARRATVGTVLVLLVGAGRGPAAQEYAFRHYGAAAGIPSAYALAFDGAGQLLVGTNDGLARFDGRAFEPVPLPVAGLVWRLASTQDGAVWAATDRADLVRIGPDGSAARVRPPGPIRDRFREALWRHRLRGDGSGRLWVSVGDGALYRWEGRRRDAWTVRQIPGAERVVDFLVRGDGNEGEVVFASDDGVGVAPLRGGQVGPVRWIPLPKRLWWVRPHPSGGVWVGGSEGVYLLSPTGTTRTVTLPGQGAWPHNEPAVDAAGRLLVPLEGAGEMTVTRFAPDGTVTLAAAGDEGLPGVLPAQLAFDPEGALWVAHAQGLTTLQDEWTLAFPLVDALGRGVTVFGMAGDPARGPLWVSTYSGMYRFDGGRGRYVGGDDAIWGAFPPVLVGGGEAEWVEFRGSHATSELRTRASRSGATQRRPLIVHTGRSGRYETDEGGLWRVRGGRRYRLGASFLPGALGAEDARGRLWLGGDSGRIDVVWGDTLGSACPSCLPPSLRAALDALNGVGQWGDVVADGQGRVWVGGLVGLGVLWERPGGTWSHRVFGPDDGLLGRSVGLALSPDGRRLWLGTIRGIQGLRLRPGEPRVEPFTEMRAQDGLPGEAVSSIVEDADGFLWVALRPGRLHRLDWQALSAPPPSPGVRVSRAQINGRSVPPTPLRLRKGDDVVLGLWPRTYRRPERVRVEYRLDASAAWMSLGTARQLALASLPPGDLTLEIRAVRPGRLPGPVTRVGVAVAAPFWETWPFALLVGLAGVGLLVTADRVREGRRRATDALRQRIASDLHDEMGGGLTQVSLYSELIRRAAEGGGDGASSEDRARVAAWADHVGTQARSLSESMRDVVWAIRPDESAWESLELRLKDAAVALLAPRGIEPDLGGEVPDRPPPLSPEVRQNVLLFVKEALHNAVRHADPTRVEVHWRLTRRTLDLRVCDDGRGFDPAAIAPGVGLASLRRRAHDLGGTLRVDTAPGGGTCLSLSVPLRGRRPARHEPTRSGR